MQVKKFEAKSMKEALQMVKQELGPEAIILNAKDNKKSFGLAGRGSIEVTAAISEKSLQKKQFTESRLPEASRDKFRNTTAKHQRSVIETTINKYQDRKQFRASQHAAEAFKPGSERTLERTIDGILQGAPRHSVGATAAKISPTPRTSGGGRRRYIDILDDDQNPNDNISGRRVDDILEEFAKTGSFVLEDSSQNATPLTISMSPDFAMDSSRDELLSMRKEIESLRGMLSQYRQAPASHGPVTQHPGAEFGLPFELAANFEKLQAAGIDGRYIVEILEKANKDLSGLEKKKRTLVDAWVARYILSHVSVTQADEPAEQPQVHFFVGPAGHGKTSVVVKLASQMVLNEKKRVVMITADTFKVGAADQLRIYAQILNVPFETLRSAEELPEFISKYRDFDAILIDCPGFALKDSEENNRIRALLPLRDIARQTHLVLSSGTKDVDAYEVATRYQVTQYQDVVVTKLDESANHGLLYNIQRKTQKPLYAFSIGSKIPEDFEVATRERVLDLIYKISKNEAGGTGT